MAAIGETDLRAAVLDSVGAAIRRIAYLTLSRDWGTSQQLLRGLYDDERSFQTARGQVEGGRGVGQPVITRYLDGRLPTGKIQTALAPSQWPSRGAVI